MILLGIETSCDDTSAGVFDGKQVLSNVISTQLVHRRFGGVVPELASRSHIELILPVIRQALEDANLKEDDLDGIAVTRGPGLAGSLLVGLSVAKGLALSRNLPIYGVNHLEGHIWANRLSHPELEPPFVVLVVSGGHTQLMHVRNWGEYHILGRTRDDAAGEAFDKVAKIMGLGFPGGPVIEKHAKTGNPECIRFPRAYLDRDGFDFSFSGLKTAVLNHVQSLDPSLLEAQLSDISASFQAAVVDVLVEKTINAALKTGVRQIALAGGVAVNKALREALTVEAQAKGMQVFWPAPEYCTDNGAMIACAGHHYLSQGQQSPLTISPKPSLNFQ